GRLVKTEGLSVRYRRNTVSSVRVLYCSERKTKSAVDRNRIKRVLRAILNTEYLPVPDHFDLALTANLEFTKMKYEFRVKALESLLSKIQ
ncbi:MAG TPA: ribonuclease P protein component, partial [Leptospiraceae bacterium]|nr:ribonuclease P protein component [Leptospiraceae bacterium]